MSIGAIVTVLWLAVKPWMWLIIPMLLVLSTAQVLGRVKGYFGLKSNCGIIPLIVAIIAGILAFFLLPWAYNSQWSYVQTTFDWVALVGGSIGVAIFAFLVVHPLAYYLRVRKAERNKAATAAAA